METNTTQQHNSAEDEWALKELGGVSLGDARLNRRLIKVATDLSKQPERPINQASQDASATIAAYRLFDNDKCKVDKILDPHIVNTKKRMQGRQVVLCNQDTTSFNYSTHHAVEGLGPIGDKKSNAQGILMHSCLATTVEGLPLGLLSVKLWTRPPHNDKKKIPPHEKKQRPIEEKESIRWIETLDAIEGIPNAVVQGDRENDIYEFLVAARDKEISVNIRSCSDRGIKSPQKLAFIKPSCKCSSSSRGRGAHPQAV